jgi:predicted nucleic acid-binding protein
LIVLDASAVLEVLLRSQLGLEIEKRIFSPTESLFAPHLIDLEVAQVVRRYCEFGEIESKRGKEAIEDLKDLPIKRYQHDIFLSRIWALRHNMTAYDAVYVALAETLHAPLLTCDAHLVSAPGHEAVIELIYPGF